MHALGIMATMSPRYSQIPPNIFAAITGAGALVSYVDQIEQWARIMATLIAIASGILALCMQIRRLRQPRPRGD